MPSIYARFKIIEEKRPEKLLSALSDVLKPFSPRIRQQFLPDEKSEAKLANPSILHQLLALDVKALDPFEAKPRGNAPETWFTPISMGIAFVAGKFKPFDEVGKAYDSFVEQLGYQFDARNEEWKRTGAPNTQFIQQNFEYLIALDQVYHLLQSSDALKNYLSEINKNIPDYWAWMKETYIDGNRNRIQHELVEFIQQKNNELLEIFHRVRSDNVKVPQPVDFLKNLNLFIDEIERFQSALNKFSDIDNPSRKSEIDLVKNNCRVLLQELNGMKDALVEVKEFKAQLREFEEKLSEIFAEQGRSSDMKALSGYQHQLDAMEGELAALRRSPVLGPFEQRQLRGREIILNAVKEKLQETIQIEKLIAPAKEKLMMIKQSISPESKDAKTFDQLIQFQWDISEIKEELSKIKPGNNLTHPRVITLCDRLQSDIQEKIDASIPKARRGAVDTKASDLPAPPLIRRPSG